MRIILRHPLFIICASILAILVGLWVNSPALDIVVSVFGMIHVWLLTKEKISNFIFGILAFGSYVYIYISTELYAMAIVAFAQTCFLIYGWYFWSRNKEESGVPVTNRFTRKQLVFWMAGMGAAWFVWGMIEKHVFHGSLPFLNSLTAVVGLTAEYWLSKKYLENWHLWIFADLMAFVTVFLSGLYPMAILMAINALLSIQGLREWKANEKTSGTLICEAERQKVAN